MNLVVLASLKVECVSRAEEQDVLEGFGLEGRGDFLLFETIRMPVCAFV